MRDLQKSLSTHTHTHTHTHTNTRAHTNTYIPDAQRQNWRFGPEAAAAANRPALASSCAETALRASVFVL